MPKKASRIFAVLFLATAILLPGRLFAAKEDFPRLANYFLKYFDRSDYQALLKWDLIITPAEMAYYNPEFFRLVREQRKPITMLSYVYPAMVYDYDRNEPTGLQRDLYQAVDRNNWWLRNGRGEKLEIWPEVYAVNVTNPGWQDYNVNYVRNQVTSKGWDGIMYDLVDASITHYSKSGGIDIDGDGRADDPAYVNKKWNEGMAELFRKTRRSLGNGKIILINGNSLSLYQPEINGRMFESFPTPWEGNGTWSATMVQYMNNLPNKNKDQKIYVINSNTRNSGAHSDYRKVRYGLASTLMGDGYYSFDYGEVSHAQTWWYDEYDLDLGRAEAGAYNLLNRGDGNVKPGLWRRDFEFGTAFVNSTDKEQVYVFPREEFEKLRGSQDRKVNDGSKINWIKLQPKDGLAVMKPNNKIVDASFNNGAFVRVFNGKGSQVRNGFFAYKDSFPGDSKVLVSDIDNRGDEEILVNGKGQISIYKNSKKKTVFSPFGKGFKQETNFAVEDLNRDGSKEIIAVAGKGGGPMVKIFNIQGKPLTPGFYAYDKNFRGGLSLAAGDLNGDGIKEILVAPVSGGSPEVRVFNKDGKLLGSFLAYDKNFRGGLSLAAGDLDGDLSDEIIVAPITGGGPQVKIFNRSGKLLGSFFAYDKNSRGNVMVIASDINRDRRDEILVSTISF